ncbi:MAG: NADPH-dependent glutamate synthase [Chloroflexi bacterium]|nr:NADPH-dependent glutamate synthase [Chloroflexota bacterium]MCI0817410.1 NADPH-dependent glutamate synthase [Chloroflexota bacterium]MCI0819378.1 NADPH-dependent glutamate synthase [Chloroflexota bacterium]MCI0831621.1 NADPH-dependent glutamate synthase [Chloroflexota bacterium]MCI0838724.1 NADPH-dependent glutamate synthase [Chloroflexota bacterium]
MPCDNHRRLAIPIQPAPKQAPKERVKNWDEAFLGYTLETAVVEAERCIHCPTAPCQEACPTDNDIPRALLLLEEDDIDGAAAVFRETSSLPDMCGRLCPQEVLCEGACVVGFAIRPEPYGKQPPVAIGKLESFIADWQRRNDGVPLPEVAAPTGRKVAIIGSGPAGIAVAEDLTKKGHKVTVFESWPVPGGVLLYGIPNFKMRKEILDYKIEWLEKLGVEFQNNTKVGEDVTVDSLFESGTDAVFLGTGAPVGGQMHIDGEELGNVYQATEFLVRGNLEPDQLPAAMREPLDVAGKRVLVVGGGDTSMDCVRTAIRLGSPAVTCMYRRTEAEQKGREEERVNAREEGTDFMYLTVPHQFTGDDNGRVTEAECRRMQLGAPDESGRRRPEPIAGSEFTLEVDIVVLAIGYEPDDLLEKTTPGLRTTNWKTVRVDEEFQTTRAGVFAGGDNVNGADLVVTAMADGQRAAIAIDNYLQSLA